MDPCQFEIIIANIYKALQFYYHYFTDKGTGRRNLSDLSGVRQLVTMRQNLQIFLSQVQYSMQYMESAIGICPLPYTA